MKVLILANNDVGLYKFRRELIETILFSHEVHVCLPNGEYVSKLQAMGCEYHSFEFDRHGINPFVEIKQLLFYRSLIKSVKPDVVFTYTVKPNVYAGMVCASLDTPYVANVTGLGTAIECGGLMQRVLLHLYKRGLRKAQKVFFQNESNRDFMLSRKVIKDNYALIPGSGVNLDEHKAEPYPEQTDQIIFVTIGRIMKDKGADELLYAAKVIHKIHTNVIFRVIGSFDGDYEEKVKTAVEEGEIEYLGYQHDIHSILKESHAIIHASYHEGMSNVLLEAAACARPIIATDVAGCREIYEAGVSGISCNARDGDDLVRAICEFVALPYCEKVEMGLKGRKKVEREFDRNIVVNQYLKEIERLQ